MTTRGDGLTTDWERAHAYQRGLSVPRPAARCSLPARAARIELPSCEALEQCGYGAVDWFSYDTHPLPAGAPHSSQH
jgi:hypothetical protein